MKIALAKEMREIDRKAIEEYGVSEILLMENAGRRVAEAFSDYLGGFSGKKICILAGSGNNGGDAFVAARHIENQGAQVRVFLVGNPEHLTEGAKLHRDIITKMGMQVHTLNAERDWDKFQVAMRFADGIVDGMIGTGFTGELREDVIRIIKFVNSLAKPVISIDIPTGVEADTGAAFGETILASLTVTFGLPKIGHLICPGKTATGKLLIDDIGIPNALLSDENIKQTFLNETMVASILLSRQLDAHKGSCGKILVIAGSRGMTGAAALSSMAALKSGAGLVTLAVPESQYALLEGRLTEIMVRPMPETVDGTLSHGALSEILSLSAAHDAVLIGPGLGRAQETKELVRSFCKEVKKPLILDADAIYAYQGYADSLKELAFVPVLTPHLGEMAGLLDITVDELKGTLLDMTREAAKEYHATFVVKSESTMVVHPDGKIFVTSKGNSGMATAGSGDVLAGAIAGMFKQTAAGLSPLAGVYIHGLAGDMAAAEKGYGLIASDILHYLPQAGMTLVK
ncbi:NAD(P)H-hydrate dehydratase [Selenomonas sp. TAMA-11512]|uniref:NAD(P)H-hydrate dehydratase n=1 Tax=Selenomonas sp. TAMA-11512 TaxID=3095337 RepID=UPI0030882D85|nr:NAD(P)H-hydrate dehydratase [Selenomonas sp. TAMA-11512]